MSFSARWPAPAKLNLMLHVTGRRTDGYHELQTVFQFLDFGDSLTFTLREDEQVRRVSEIGAVPAAQDLVVRAARLLQAQTGYRCGVDIAIEKRIPMGGGLGGGSSDAATTLVALNTLWKLGLGVDALARLGLQLGADVPVFVRGSAAWAEGVGDQLQVIDLPEPWYLVISPDCSVSTAAVFADPELTRDTVPIKIADFLSAGGRNDCEAVVRARYPAVAAALDWLDQYAVARLTGTGSSVFASFADKRSAADLLAHLPPAWQGFVAKGCNRSGLLDRLAG